MMLKRLLLAMIALLVLAGLILGSVGYWWLSQKNLNQTSVVVVIEKGQSLNSMAQQWEDQGWLRSALRLKVAARLTGGARDVRAGEFIIPPGLSSLSILPYLAEAQTRTYRVSLIEGRRLSAALEALSQAEYLQQDLGALTVERVSDYLGLTVHAEAQLYPDTYVYHRNQPVSEIITQAHERLNKVLNEEWQARVANLPYTSPYEALVMAHPGDRVLVRNVNAGQDPHPMHYHGENLRFIGRDGKMLSSDGLVSDLGRSDNTINSDPKQSIDAIWTWTGKDLNWDIYGHDTAHNCVDTDGDGFGDGPDNTYAHEYCADHGKPVPVTLPGVGELSLGGWWSGSPFLGDTGDLPPGEGGLNPFGGYFLVWHSHAEKELTTFDIFPGGTLGSVVVLPPYVDIQ